jgi:hypothetical protein
MFDPAPVMYTAGLTGLASEAFCWQYVGLSSHQCMWLLPSLPVVWQKMGNAWQGPCTLWCVHDTVTFHKGQAYRLATPVIAHMPASA